ncbi:dihydroorotate dehydrogenase B catalytic subunit [candidate division LCP-89 bacterium B3_LCP]|uniref:Dihydroorotate dehydrogenase n=1 Tax=candidate division LCP-89 bacterium B3_LCP TaxID=2012998 RepID=A0A532UZA7_UNCL8|nr:MAG: dihydroorotate dehydrogenase B catalytic subunit [candidate division LCP-89 bacterium B3_LCP]
MKVDLSVKLGKLDLKNPVLVASGTFGYGTEYAELIDVSRLGGIITKTITPQPRPGNPPPRIWETSGGMLNSIGLANVGSDAFITDKLPALREIDTAIIVNIAGSNVEEYWELIEKLDDQTGIDAYEINISCPNVKDEGMAFGSNPAVTEEIISGIRQRTERPVIPKLTPNVTSIAEIARVCADSGADAVSLINTLVGMSVDIETRRPQLATVTGGYSGPPIKPVALAKVLEVRRAVSIPIIGIGGISKASDALEFIITGANAVQIGTANFVDPQAPLEVLSGIEEFCISHDISGVQDLVGTLDI